MKIDFTFITFFNFFINLLILNNFLLPKLLLMVIFIFILKKQLKSLIYDFRLELAEKNPIKFFYLYKIKNFYLIWFWIFIYFFVFVFLLFSFRIYRIGYKLDLNFIKQTYSSLYSLGEYLLILLLTISIVIFLLTTLLILKKIKIFLEIYLLQKHLYLINYTKTKTFDNMIDVFYTPPIIGSSEEEKIQEKDKYLKNGFYKKIFYYFYFFSYSHFFCIVNDINHKFYCRFIDGTRFNNSEIINFPNHIRTIFDPKYNIIIPIGIFFYELIFCNLTIIYLFYFLPFYLTYTLWYKLSRFWYLDRIPRLDAILYELYYDFPKIMYLNLDQKELNVIFRYILGGLNILPNADVDENSTSFSITYYKRYILYDDKMYINKNIKDSITKEEYKMQKDSTLYDCDFF